jgi:hypothetical protein
MTYHRVCNQINTTGVTSGAGTAYQTLHGKLMIEQHGTQEEFEDTKGAIRIHISKKNRHHNGQKKKYKRTNNDQQNIHIKLKHNIHISNDNGTFPFYPFANKVAKGYSNATVLPFVISLRTL